mgnify:CR=1 FL=1
MEARNQQLKQKITSVLIIFALSFSINVFAQGPPPWAPAHGFRKNTTYVYFPTHNFYFDISRNVYFVWSSSRWVPYRSLPTHLRSVNLRTVKRVELDIVTKHPYYYNTNHRKQYYTGGKGKATPAKKGNAVKHSPAKAPHKKSPAYKSPSKHQGSPGNSGKGKGNGGGPKGKK